MKPKLPLLQIVPAGAGSGKTYKIQTDLFNWIDKGLIAPERIVAVTFTEAAAAELRDRIRAELVRNARVEDALKLDEAYISTIHSFGLRIITEFAFEAGESPQPRLLNEDEKDILISLALSRSAAADEIKDDLEAFGYTYDFNSGEGPEDRFRGTLLGLIEKLRSVGSLALNNVLVPHALKKIKRIYGHTADGKVLNKDLLSAVKALLKQFPNKQSVNVDGKKTGSALDEMRANFVAFDRAKSGDIERDWALWQELRSLRISNKAVKLTAGYDSLAEAVMSAAERLPEHPGPLEQAKVHAAGLLGAGQETLSQYRMDKKHRGLVDYVDMVDIARQLLGKPEVLAELKSRIDCVVIDEFQDTNPLQFSLLWALAQAKIPMLIVGDLKQAIMGFQNADPRLMKQLSDDHPDESTPLPNNYRSCDALMAWINNLGKGLFGPGYQALTPRANIESVMAPLEIVDLPEYPYYGKTIIPAQYTAQRIRDLLADPKQKVFLKDKKQYRRLRGGDIAVLCPTNARLGKYAEVLATLGIRTRMDSDGWFESRVIQIAYHALAYAANPEDLHAALYLAVTELGSHDMGSALAKVADKQAVEEKYFAALREAGAAGDSRFVDTVVADVIGALDLYGVVSGWRDASQARANLLRLQGEAHEFMSANREALASGGMYGAGLKSFLAWLVKRVDSDDSQPAARVIDEDAVELVTWHRSKGREWPVVVVASADCKIDPRLPWFDIEYDDFKDLSRILEKAKIRFSPCFDAPEATARFAEELQEQLELEARRLLYAALTRAKEKIILEWPRYQDAQNAKKAKDGEEEFVSYWTLLTGATGLSFAPAERTLVVCDENCNCLVTEGGKYTPAEFEDAKKEGKASLPVTGRRAIKPGKMSEKLTPEAIMPSSLHVEEPAKVTGLVTQTYGKGLELEGDLEPMERGNILHRCFEVLAQREVGVEPLRKATGYAFTEKEYKGVTEAVADLGKFLEKHFSPVSLSREVPILALNKDGSVVSGVVDLVVETAQGLWILDHKTDTSDDLAMKFGDYALQLQAYTEAVEGAMKGKKVIGVGINWVKYGKVTCTSGLY